MFKTFVTQHLPTVITTWNIAAVFIVLMYLYWWRRPNGFPPGPRGVPLLGAAPFMGQFPGRTLKKWSLDKNGPVMSVRMGTEDFVVLNTFEAIQQALVKQSGSYSGRVEFVLTRLTGADGLVSLDYDEKFKTQKHFGLKFLREKGLGRKSMEKILNEEGDRFIDFLRSFKGKPVDLRTYLYWLTSNVVSKITLGERSNYGDEKFMRTLEALSQLFSDPKDAWKISLLALFPKLLKYPPFTGALERFEVRHQIILDYIQEFIDKSRNGLDPNNINSFIDAFICEQQFGSKLNDTFTDNQLLAYTRDIFLAGSETSSTALTWCFGFLLNYPEYHRIIDKEITDIVGIEGEVCMSHRPDMTMTCAFLQEVMRIKAIVPLSVIHLTTETTRLMGYHIPKGTKIISNLEGAHMDPQDWPNPEEFNPRRHIDQNGKFVYSNKVIPFSIGARFCLGESLARAEVFIFFIKIIQKFKIQCSKEYPPRLDNQAMSLTLSLQECDVCLTEKV